MSHNPPSPPPPPPLPSDKVGLPFAPLHKATAALAAQHHVKVSKPADDMLNALLSGKITSFVVVLVGWVSGWAGWIGWGRMSE